MRIARLTRVPLREIWAREARDPGFERASAESAAETVQSISIPLPPLPEQRAIAEVLSDMDAAIAALERQRAKVQALKQGMMAELLTGRVRLPVQQDGQQMVDRGGQHAHQTDRS